MIRIELTIEADEVQDLLDSKPVQQAIRAWVPGSILRATRFLHEEITSRTQTRSGLLKNDVGIQATDHGYQVVARAPYASFVNDGTRPHEIRPRNAKALAFPRAGGVITRSNNGHVRTKFQHGGKTAIRSAVFARVVRHPGTRPRPFAQATAARLERSEPAALEAHLNQALGGAT